MTDQTVAEHLIAYHGFAGTGEASEAALANYCHSLEDYHAELHNPDYYEHIDEEPPTHTVEDLRTAQPPTYHSDALGVVTIPED